MFPIQIKRPKNNHVIKEFCQENNYKYRFPDGSMVPMQVQYAWCHRCEQFVEAERLYTQEEIQQWLDKLEAVRYKWPKIDAGELLWWKVQGKPLSEFRTKLQKYEAWKTALLWCKRRKSTPRCLECSSFTAVVILPQYEEIAHPDDEGEIIVTINADFVYPESFSWPDDLPPVFFDEEGIREGNRGQALVPS